MHRALFLTPWVFIGRNSLQHDHVVLLNQVDDFALNVGQTLLDQRGLDEVAGHGRELEFSKLVGIGLTFSGGADYTDHKLIWAVLDKVLAKHPDMVLIHGGTPKGAEKAAAC